MPGSLDSTITTSELTVRAGEVAGPFRLREAGSFGWGFSGWLLFLLDRVRVDQLWFGGS